ncbi:hypothetical protein LO772_06305 [Yinghuangia sp. ASG 101]|uniref:hypothetical protein n=1 Tax=Yinghuangia sp. ASG 101 TaxID=2896848 RepID=UPI001E61DD50|nr:hypothetical protein [Yinghuangia sp. ASG 101]UGQ13226.1 hypothetical protein LO772_06305 [Yinghuangia sp. ASG 101]
MPPLDPSPYVVLDLPPDATVKDVNVAVGRAVRAGRYTRQQINAAAALLRNPARRLEADVQRHLPRPAPADVRDELAAAAREPLLPAPAPGRLPDPASLVVLRDAETAADRADPPEPEGGARRPYVPERFRPDAARLLPPVPLPD